MASSMLVRITFPIVLLLTPGNYSQHSAQCIEPNGSSAFTGITRSHQQQVAPLDTSLVLQRYPEAGSEERSFIEQLLDIYRQFSGRNPDTTLYKYGDIDGLGGIDTLQSHVYIESETVYVHSWWEKNGVRLWEYELINPYLWISDSELFAYDLRSPWVTFTIGVLHAPPGLRSINEFHDIPVYRDMPTETVVDYGISYLGSLGHDVTTEEYIEYLKDYRGLLITYGDPESRSGHFIWYEPAKCFALYYHP